MGKISVHSLLQELPAYKDDWVLVTEDQRTRDIIKQIQRAHEKYAPYYDKIALYFNAPSLVKICENLYWFCKNNIAYREETKELQTTALPTGILTRQYGDCKHYASFCGGVLDALSRITGKKINWAYRFAAYDGAIMPHHVFVVVNDNGRELWIDPVPGANDETPSYVKDVKIKSLSMPLYDNIGSISTAERLRNASRGQTIGWTVETSYGYTTSGPTIVPKIGDSFYGNDWLGLSRYGNPTNTNLDTLTAQLQQEINRGPSPYTLQKSLLEKVLRDNVAYWNFYYPKGTSPIPRNWKNDPMLKNYLMLTMTPDGRLTFDRDEEPPHTWNGIHKLTDWTNYLVQAYSDEPYIPLIDHMKRLGKGWKTPQSGSLWHVIHEGDKNLATMVSLIKKIPGLEAITNSLGFSLDTLTNAASKFFGGGGTATIPGGGSTTIPPAGTGYPTNTGYDPVNYPMPNDTDPTASTGIDQNLMIGAGIGLATWFFTKKITLAAGAGLGYILITRKSSPTSAAGQRAALKNYFASIPDAQLPASQKDYVNSVFSMMSDAEIKAAYTWVMEMIPKKIPLTEGTPLYNDINAISTKYAIFT